MSRKPFKAVPIKLGKRYRAQRQRQRLWTVGKVAGIFGAAAIVGGVIGTAPTVVSVFGAKTVYRQEVQNCVTVDGDTLRCGSLRIRLLGIDAPELPGHCAEGRDCAPGDPYESSRSLKEALGDGFSVMIDPVGTDRYGRTLAMVQGRRGDLSCWQLSHGQAIYKWRWDNGGRVAKACPADAR